MSQRDGSMTPATMALASMALAPMALAPMALAPMVARLWSTTLVKGACAMSQRPQWPLDNGSSHGSMAHMRALDVSVRAIDASLPPPPPLAQLSSPAPHARLAQVESAEGRPIKGERGRSQSKARGEGASQRREGKEPLKGKR
jgi:hypothetical protein